MSKNLHQLFAFVWVFTFIPALFASGGGGGCTFSNTCSGATAVTCGTNYSMANSACDANNDCCGCWAGCAGGCDICSLPLPAHNEDCQASAMGMLCFIEGTFCGSPENTQWATFCPATTGTYDFNFTSISCSGGGASLQFGIYNAGINCTTNDQTNLLDCNGGFVGSTTVSYALTGGSCYLMVFDGNAGAVCTWGFNITCVVLPVQLSTYTGEFVSDRTIRLNWTTDRETDCKEFYFIRRYDNLVRESGKTLDEQMNMREVVQFGPIAPKGGDNGGADYTFYDTKADRPGLYYYELYERDLNGTNRYLGLQVVNVNSPERSAITSVIYNSMDGSYSLEFDMSADAALNFNLYASDGRRVESQYLGVKGAGHHSVRVETSSLEPGIYIYEINIGGKSYSRKLLVK